MPFTDFPEQRQAVALLQRSLDRGRLGHAYLFSGHQLPQLEALARTLAQTLNCRQPVRLSPNGPPVDCCDTCDSCRRIQTDNHGDIHWVRAESKSRIIRIEQMREVMQELNYKPNDAEYKVAVIVAADRMNEQAANAFLKTLEEPPSKSILILLSIAPQRLLETIISRCLRLNFAADAGWTPATAHEAWLNDFGEVAGAEQKSLLGRYRLLAQLLNKLAAMKSAIEEKLTAGSPLEQHDDIEKDLRDRWEDELTAAIEAEYRLQRSELLAALQWWFRDVWVQTLGIQGELLSFPQQPGIARVAARISPTQAAENLRILEGAQRLLHTNVQEALALEVELLKLHL